MKLHSLLNCLPFYNSPSTIQNPSILSIEMDSREVQEGSLFICIKGFTVDGHDFVDQAVKQGAVAVIAERPLSLSIPVIVVNDTNRAMAMIADYFYDSPTQKLHLIGVTGTNGKTTTTYLIDHIFNKLGKRTGLIGTIHTKIAGKEYEVKNTTPESLTLQKTFYQMERENVDVALMEVSSHALDLGRVRGCDFDVAVFTNLSQDHLDYHKNMDEYQRAKGLLFSQLGNRYEVNSPKFAVLNDDDPASKQYKKSTSAHVITYGINSYSDVTASHITITSKGTQFTLNTPNGSLVIEMKLIGKFSIYNALAAAAAALVSGVPLELIKESLESVEGVPGRFEVVDCNQPFTVIVDYAHTPDSLENVLSTIRQFSEGKIWVVVGCGGDRDKTKRPLMAHIAEQYADYPILTSDNPRSEDPNAILRDMEKGLRKSTAISILDRKEAIHYAVTNANEKDVVLLAGKGHETYQIVGTKTFEFDDRKVAAQLIKGNLK